MTQAHTNHPDLHNPASLLQLRRSLIPLVRLLDTTETQGRLLEIPLQILERAAAGEIPDALSPDQLTRMSLMVQMYASLRNLFPGPASDQWLTRPNNRATLAGKRPMD